MNPLSSMIVLDFCEWLKNRIEATDDQSDVDIIELVLNDEYRSYLKKYSREYLAEGGFKLELKNLWGPPISDERLADSTRFILTSRKEPRLTNFMRATNLNLFIEIDFLEWLMISKNKPINLQKMPLQVFEGLVDEFCAIERKHSDEKKTLIKAFKQTDPVALARKLLAVLTNSQSNKMKSLGYIYDRYSNHSIPYKCLFLSLAANAESFKSFINKYWIDLNNLSGDHLDIYYSEQELGKSGYEIRNDIKSIPKYLPGKLPCIVLWGENMSSAKVIDIKGLSDENLVRLISVIVDLIKVKTPFNMIIERADNMSKEFVNLERPITKISNSTINNGINYGFMGTNNGTMDNSNSKMNVNTFAYEAEEAINLIRQHTEPSEQQKEALIEIINEAKNAVEKNSVDAMKQNKEKFKYFILGAGNAIKNLLTVLSSLTNIAKFFNINLP